MARLAAWVWTLVWFLATAFFGLFFYASYWRWRGCFNEEGRCWTGEVVHDHQSVVLALPLAVSVIAALFGFLWLIKLSVRSPDRM